MAKTQLEQIKDDQIKARAEAAIVAKAQRARTQLAFIEGAKLRKEAEALRKKTGTAVDVIEEAKRINLAKGEKVKAQAKAKAKAVLKPKTVKAKAKE